MDQLLTNPAFQSSIIPFTAALVSLLILRPAGGYWSGLALLVGFYAAVHFIVGLQFLPFISHTRKIFALGIAAAVIGMIIDFFPVPRKYHLGILAVASISAVLWIIWPNLMRKEGFDMVIFVILAPLYVTWLVITSENKRLVQPGLLAVLFSLAVGTSISALLGATALHGQLAGAIAAASGAFVLLGLLNQNTTLGTSFTFPLSLLLGLIGTAAVIYASLPWYILAILGSVMLLPGVPIPAKLGRVKTLLVMLALSLLIVMVAIGLTWQSEGAPPI